MCPVPSALHHPLARTHPDLQEAFLPPILGPDQVKSTAIYISCTRIYICTHHRHSMPRDEIELAEAAQSGIPLVRRQKAKNRRAQVKFLNI